MGRRSELRLRKTSARINLCKWRLFNRLPSADTKKGIAGH